MLSDRVFDAELTSIQSLFPNHQDHSTTAAVLGAAGNVVASPVGINRVFGRVRKHIPFVKSVRFRIALMLCTAKFAIQFMNSCMSVAVIPIAQEHTHVNSTGDDACSHHHKLWASNTFVGVVLAAVSMGRLATPITGQLADKHSLKHLVGYGALLAALASALIPVAACHRPQAVVALRMGIGLCDATIQPSVNRLLTIWFPANERSRAVGIAGCGNQLGSLMGVFLAGYLSTRTDWLGGWPLTFYCPVVFVLLWTPFWFFWIKQTPKKHRFLKSFERHYIAEFNETPRTGPAKKVRVIWKNMFRSTALWAMIAAIMCNELPISTIFIFTPRFLKDILDLDIGILGTISACAALSLLISKLCICHLMEFIAKKYNLSRTLIARISNAAACVGVCTALSLLASVTKLHPEIGPYMLVLAAASAGFYVPGCVGCLTKLAPRATGAISGVVMFTTGLGSIALPICIKSLIGTAEERQELIRDWMYVWEVVAIVAALPLGFFSVWGVAEEQKDWIEELDEDAEDADGEGYTGYIRRRSSEIVENIKLAVPTVTLKVPQRPANG